MVKYGYGQNSELPSPSWKMKEPGKFSSSSLGMTQQARQTRGTAPPPRSAAIAGSL